jgi:hypothetical protein
MHHVRCDVHHAVTRADKEPNNCVDRGYKPMKRDRIWLRGWVAEIWNSGSGISGKELPSG